MVSSYRFGPCKSCGHPKHQHSNDELCFAALNKFDKHSKMCSCKRYVLTNSSYTKKPKGGIRYSRLT